MKKIAILLGLSFAGAANASLVVTGSSDANALSNALVGSGVTISSASLTSDVANGSGVFSGGISSGLAMDSGIILSTGSVFDAPGPNSSSSTSGTGASTSLTFDFTSTSGNVFFNYIFASEEYNEFVNSGFNDSFSLLLDGINIALLPGTSTAVTIDNVNLGTNSSFFNDNTSGLFDIEYDGLTSMLTAQFLGLSAGSHSLSFNISDVGDSSYDSAVFVQGGSLSDGEPDTNVPEPASIALLGLGLAGLVFSKKKKAA